MPSAAVRFNLDGTTRVTLVDSSTGEPVEGFNWATHAFRNDDGYTVQMETLDGTKVDTVTTVGPDDIVGARDQAAIAQILDEQEPL
jgi:hypothetical protein